ncbi:hypothetical protein [Halobacteriaceae bacterium SHR40]|uniref:hypothetical protein n=1 Tax=Halovenus amylolytica TaxID=2500550 RepID=UPI000FE30225
MTRARRQGRYHGQGWFLEDETREWLMTLDRRVTTRKLFWGHEVDVVARRDSDEQPKRLLGSCKDWYQKQKITPCTLWRLIALSMTARAEPVLIYNHRAELTDTAQQIAENWRVRLVTDEDVLSNAPLPEPERPSRGTNTQYPPLLSWDVDRPHEWAPDYYGVLDTEEAWDVLDIALP